MTWQWKDTDSDKNCMEEYFERDAKSDVELDHWDMLWHGRWNVKYFLLVCLYVIQPWSHNCQLYRSNFIVDSVIVKNINLYSVDIWISAVLCPAAVLQCICSRPRNDESCKFTSGQVCYNLAAIMLQRTGYGQGAAGQLSHGWHSHTGDFLFGHHLGGASLGSKERRPGRG